MHREPQVPQPARSQSAVTHEGSTHEESTLTLPGVSPASPVQSSGLLSQQRCIICQKQTSPCL